MKTSALKCRGVVALLLLSGLLLCVSSVAWAQDFSELGSALTPDKASQVDLTGSLRLRGEMLYNLDLDHGLTPSGASLFPVPLADPSAQALYHADMRLRTDVSAYAPFGSVRVNVRLDVFDNLALGSTPDNSPLLTTSQRSPGQAVQIKRAYGEALTPLGVIVAGRMANTWGLGMVANGGECSDCNTSDAADRVAFITSQFDHFFAVAYDLAFVGPLADRKNNNRTIDIEPSDDVRTWTFAILRRRDALVLARRNKAKRLTLDYGLSASFRSQDNDVPAWYLTTTQSVPLDRNQVIRRNFSGQLYDGWIRFVSDSIRIEAEAALSMATIEEVSLIPGARFNTPVTSTQYGFAVETEFGSPLARLSGGLNLGFASGDRAPGFGARPTTQSTRAQAGDLEGAQANPPFDRTVDNFRFHPDYQIDQILFREIIGTVTDAFYLRPHLRVDLWRRTAGRLQLKMAAVFSRAVFASSTPGNQENLGIEIDPSLSYRSLDGFGMDLDYGVLFPLAGLDNVVQDRSAKPAHLLKVRLSYAF